MSEIKFTNQFPAELSASLTAIATTLSLKSGHGDEFPVIANGQDKHFFVTVVDKNGNREIVKIIQRASGTDTLVVGSSIADQPSGNVSGRAQEGTTALAVTYTDDHLVELRLTAGIMEWISGAIPAGETILFEKDTAVVGYALKTDVDDGLVYITKGSGASGEAGGTAKAGGAWTVSGLSHAHTHTGPSHVHTGPSHTHGVSGDTGDCNETSVYYTPGASYFNISWLPSHKHSVSLTSGSGGSGNTGSAGDGNTGAANVESITSTGAWRPSGRNFTRQMRN